MKTEQNRTKPNGNARATVKSSSPFPSTLGPRRSTCGWAPSRLLYKTGKTGRFAKPKKLTRCTPVTCDAHLAPRPIFNPLEPSPCLCASVVSARISPFLASLELPQESEKNRPFPECRFCNAHLPTFPLSHLRPSSPGRENAATKGAGTGLICMGPRSLGVRQQERRY